MNTIDKRASDPQGTEIFFNARDHIYWSTCNATPAHGEPHPDDSLPILYESVTAFVSRFFPVFNEREAAERTARRRNTTPGLILNEWAYLRQDASRSGTRVHEICEDCLLGNPPRHSPGSERERKVFEIAWGEAQKVKAVSRVVCVEHIVFHTPTRIAGTIDLCVKDGGGALWLLDWKTSKEIKRASPYGENALFPVEHLPACDLSKYELQLSAYETILRSQRYVPAGTQIRRALIHVREGGAEVIECADRTAEIHEMLVHKLTTPPF
ncbi:MAG: PD-(D/E)XK nuclease family protein [Kiritimatiellaeota bacterium]|nr:PD-(D/E)XK nuclease family protein [Kiritimatiellota bacterium]